jgi:hypothetical protein
MGIGSTFPSVSSFDRDVTLTELQGSIDSSFDIYQSLGFDKELQKYLSEEIISKNPFKKNANPFIGLEEDLPFRNFTVLSPGVLEKDERILKRTSPMKHRVQYEEHLVATERLDGILRPIMGKRMQKMSEEEGLDIKIPFSFLLEYPDLVEDIDEPFSRYCVICEKLDVLSGEETSEIVQNMSEDQQIDLARRICCFIEKTGYVDAHYGNFRFTVKGELACIDEESFGLLRLEGFESVQNIPFEKYVEIGLQTFLQKGCFHSEAMKEFVEGRLSK